MHGTRGTDLRRRLIIAEFMIGAIAGIAIGLFVVVSSERALGALIGSYAIGVGANYVPLALHALSLRDPSALRSELRNVDIAATLRHYTGTQFWVFVPFLFVWLDAKQRRARSTG